MDFGTWLNATLWTHRAINHFQLSVSCFRCFNNYTLLLIFIVCYTKTLHTIECKMNRVILFCVWFCEADDSVASNYLKKTSLKCYHFLLLCLTYRRFRKPDRTDWSALSRQNADVARRFRLTTMGIYWFYRFVWDIRRAAKIIYREGLY